MRIILPLGVLTEKLIIIIVTGLMHVSNFALILMEEHTA
jgi:hypothetical protein